MAQLRRTTTTQKGLGWQHQKQVARLKAQHVDGAPCWWCGDPMWNDQDLEGDHSKPRSKGGQRADRLLHAACNRQRGDGSNDDARPALRRRNGGHDGNVIAWDYA